MAATQPGCTPPQRTLFRLLVLPVVGLVLAAVVANVAFAAFLATRRSLAAARRQQEQVALALEQSRVALSPQVLDTLRLLTGSEFIVWNPAAGTAGLTTLPADLLARRSPAELATAEGGELLLAGTRYHIGAARARGVRPETVLVLTPVGGLIGTTLEATWPVLAVAAATLAVLIPLGMLTTGRLARRITGIERHVARIAAGHFGTRLSAATDRSRHVRDDISRLADGVDHLSETLQDLRSRLVAGERQRLLGQLAAGFAHELRNAVTGARLAIDLHRRRCPAGDASGDDSLTVASRQLDILEGEVRGLLAVGRPDEAPISPVDLGALLREVRELTGPRGDHAGVRVVEAVPENAPRISGRRAALRSALVNLMVNAIDAAGRHGQVRLSARVAGDHLELLVEDDGPGPPAELAGSLGEPFVTGKPEGVGLGLAVARAVAEEHGGRLSWQRHDGRTRFSLCLPLTAADLPREGAEP